MDSYTGKTFHPMNIREDDIAYSFALMCRGSRQLLYFYSVA